MISDFENFHRPVGNVLGHVYSIFCLLFDQAIFSLLLSCLYTDELQNFKNNIKEKFYQDI
jgi:hypothetical protein